MLLYRNALTYLKNNEPITFRSRSPLFPGIDELPYACYHLYTRDEENPPIFYVVSAGHERAYPGKLNPPRTIARFCIHYVIRGKGYINGKLVRAGQLFYVLPKQTHELLADKDEPWEYYYMTVAGRNVQEVINASGLLHLNPIADYSLHEEQLALFREILYNTHENKDLGLYLISGFMHLISYHKRLVPPISVHEHEKNASFLYYQEALSFISKQFNANISAAEVAQYLHISPSYLRSVFATHCKYSLRELLLRKRIDYAAKQLTSQNLSVLQAAALAGYSDPTIFSRIFKKYTGMLPKDYRKKNGSALLLEEDITKNVPPAP